jgi:ABC-type bacteriocin/lantibiotic exporter with double-glycine peptidase domain
VINGISNDIVYYNDPAAKTGKLTISVEDFLKAWKKRFIVVRPANESQEIAMTNKSS